MSALALTGFSHEGLTPYNKYHHMHSRHDQDAAEVHDVLPTNEGWTAAELFASVTESEESNENNEPMKS